MSIVVLSVTVLSSAATQLSFSNHGMIITFLFDTQVGFIMHQNLQGEMRRKAYRWLHRYLD